MEKKSEPASEMVTTVPPPSMAHCTSDSGEHEEGEGEEQQAVEMGGHQRTQHHLPDGGRDDHEPACPAAAVDERAEQGRDDGEGGQGEEEVQQDLVVGSVR